ncbi:MAG: DUF2177 family protein [Caldimonas sp.]
MTDARLSIGAFGLAYAAALATLLVLDGVWLGVVARDLYQREMGTLLADSVKLAPAAVFYLFYPLALVFLTMASPPSGWGEAIGRGAVLGLAAYGAYDLTNLSILRGWPLQISLIDWAWGGVLSAAMAAAAYAVTWARSGS